MAPQPTWWNLGIWAASWLGSFCVFEGLAVWWARCPWDTFSRFIWDLQARWDFATVGVVAILGILISHLVNLRQIQEGDRRPLREKAKEARGEAKARHAQAVLAAHTAAQGYP